MSERMSGRKQKRKKEKHHMNNIEISNNYWLLV